MSAQLKFYYATARLTNTYIERRFAKTLRVLAAPPFFVCIRDPSPYHCKILASPTLNFLTIFLENFVKQSRVGEAEILALCGSEFFVRAKKTPAANTLAVLASGVFKAQAGKARRKALKFPLSRHKKPRRKRRAALCQNF